MPKYEWRSLADKSKHKFTEHLMWELAAKDAIAGPDLHSTLWHTIASIMESAASARRFDDVSAQQHNHDHYHTQPDTDHNDLSIEHATGESTAAANGMSHPPHVPTHSIKSMIRYQSFLKYLSESGAEGLLAKSLASLHLRNDRWLWILECPFFAQYDALRGWAAEARGYAKNCSSIAKEQAANGFLAMIEKSLEEGDGWLHRFARNDPQLPHTILIEAVAATADSLAIPRRYISDPNEILKHHASTWSGHWKSHDQALCEETIRVIKANMHLIQSGPDTRKTSTAERIRRAAKSFKEGTSTGVDNWMISEIPLMPDVVLESLGHLLSDIQDQAIPPLQAFTNIMATLPKKDGGSRTVAIASTIYRLLMELDNEELEQFERTNAFVNDSAKAGASGTIATEDRALEAEMAHDAGCHTLTMLYDMKKFFDSINISKLFELAAACLFPLKLVLSMVVHHAPRRLKLSTALSEPITALGRSILAGCKRSTQLARVYTLQMVKGLAQAHQGIT